MKPHKSIQVFENPILEKLTHVHPLTPLVIWVPIVSWLLWHSFVDLRLDFLSFGIFGISGFIVWTFVEYILHRFAFHYEGKSRIAQRVHFLIHGLHHLDPIDPTRLVMPPVVSIFLAIALYSSFRFILGRNFVVPFFAFFVIGYLCYDYIHFYVHHFIPKNKIGKFLKNSHMQHHYINPNTRLGVSSPLWDFIFGTWANESQISGVSEQFSEQGYEQDRKMT